MVLTILSVFSCNNPKASVGKSIILPNQIDTASISTSNSNINKNIIENDSVINFEGNWVVNSYFLRNISATSDVEASKYIGDTIKIVNGKFSNFLGQSCMFDTFNNEKKVLDEEIINKLKLDKKTANEITLNCSKYKEYFYLLDSIKIVYEADGAVYLLQK